MKSTYEDLAFAEAAYIFLLASSYLLMVSGYRRAGLMLALFSLLPPVFASAKYYALFVTLAYEFSNETFGLTRSSAYSPSSF